LLSSQAELFHIMLRELHLPVGQWRSAEMPNSKARPASGRTSARARNYSCFFSEWPEFMRHALKLGLVARDQIACAIGSRVANGRAHHHTILDNAFAAVFN